jgi:hypothetical protein
MKKLIVLLLFIPLVSFGQVTLDNILNIKTEQDFKRTFIEAGFQEETAPENADKLVTYTKEIVNQSISASFRRSDSLSAKLVAVMFTPDMFDRNVIYDGIYDKVKEECIFFEVRNSVGMDVAFYNCPNPNPDPRLVELDKKLRKEIPNRPNPDLNLSDLQIGFVKNNGLFIIQYPIFDVFVDELIKMSDEMIKMMKEMEKEESNQ